MAQYPGGSGYPGYPPPAYSASQPQSYPSAGVPPSPYPYPASGAAVYHPPPPQSAPQYPTPYPQPPPPSTTYVIESRPRPHRPCDDKVVIRAGFPGFNERIVIQEGHHHHHLRHHHPHVSKTVIRDGRDKIVIKERGDKVIVKEKHKRGGWW